MSETLISRRTLALYLAALPVAGANNMEASKSAEGEGLVHTADAIHQEMTFKASRQKVYEALTTSKQFDAITRLSDAIALMEAPGAKPTSISHEPGGTFTLFGGYITGRNVQTTPNQRLVQAWRTASWPEGDYSIVKFTLIADGDMTRMLFDHQGFPSGEGGHLASGWHSHYWDPMAKFLAQA